jgi:hypothetical protein
MNSNSSDKPISATIKIEYMSEHIIEEFDEIIKKKMRNINVLWYAQGYNLEEKKRDICFDLIFNKQGNK